jgi:hypothetical protein
MMIDENLARLRAHRNNIGRYRRLLQTTLTVLERDFIERRLSEEETALNLIVCNTFPLVVAIPDMRAPGWLRPVGRGSTSPKPT